jgi:hypothetical protein
MLGSKLELLVNLRNQNSYFPFIFSVSTLIALMRNYTKIQKKKMGILPISPTNYPVCVDWNSD